MNESKVLLSHFAASVIDDRNQTGGVHGDADQFFVEFTAKTTFKYTFWIPGIPVANFGVAAEKHGCLAGELRAFVGSTLRAEVFTFGVAEDAVGDDLLDAEGLFRFGSRNELWGIENDPQNSEECVGGIDEATFGDRGDDQQHL